jgi:hypothetical protein
MEAPTDERNNRDDIDLATIIVRPLYFGLSVNVMIPMALLLGIYYLNENYEPANLIRPFQNTVFAIFAALAVIQAGIILFWRNRSLDRPMIRRPEQLERDFADALLARSKPIFIAIAALSIYGYIFFFISGEFKETVIFVVFSFVVFQVARPRYGSARKLLKYQRELVDKGYLLRD